MPTNLTGSTIASTFDQLLHVSDGPTATPKTVYSGTGVATAMKLGTQSVEFDNIKLDGNIISVTNTNGNLNFVPNGTGNITIGNVNITSGSITGITDLAVADGGTGASSLTGYVKGNGTSPFTASATIPITDVANLNYGIFYDLSDQSFVADTPTAVEFDTTGIVDDVSVVSSTRITFANAGTYQVASRLQFENSAAANDYNVDVWFRLDGTDIPNSASQLAIPRQNAVNGRMTHAVTGLLTVTAGQYLEVVVAVENAAVTLHYDPAKTTGGGDPYDRPNVPSAIIAIERIV